MILDNKVVEDLDKSRYYYQQDEQYSTAFITDKAGTVKNFYKYDAFGNIVESQEALPNRITYTGQQYDAITQQYYLRARFYNPILGRFMQEDPYHEDGLNLYAYCKNNPVMYYDPSGYASKKPNCGDKGDQSPKDNENSSNKGSGGTEHKIGENGTQTSSTTTGKGKKGKERVDVENPNPGQRDGDLHYHEPDNTKWKYNLSGETLTDYDGVPAPPKVQKVLKESWVQKAIKKGKNILGED